MIRYYFCRFCAYFCLGFSHGNAYAWRQFYVWKERAGSWRPSPEAEF